MVPFQCLRNIWCLGWAVMHVQEDPFASNGLEIARIHILLKYIGANPKDGKTRIGLDVQLINSGWTLSEGIYTAKSSRFRLFYLSNHPFTGRIAACNANTIAKMLEGLNPSLHQS